MVWRTPGSAAECHRTTGTAPRAATTCPPECRPRLFGTDVPGSQGCPRGGPAPRSGWCRPFPRRTFGMAVYPAVPGGAGERCCTRRDDERPRLDDSQGKQSLSNGDCAATQRRPVDWGLYTMSDSSRVPRGAGQVGAAVGLSPAVLQRVRVGAPPEAPRIPSARRVAGTRRGELPRERNQLHGPVA